MMSKCALVESNTDDEASLCCEWISQLYEEREVLTAV